MQYIYLFDQSGRCLSRRGTDNPSMAEQLCQHQEGAASFIVTTEEVDVTRAWNEDGTLVDRAPPPPQLQYWQERLDAYPTIGDQLDAFWHAMNNGVIPKVEPFFSQIKAVKDAYPKPNPTQ